MSRQLALILACMLLAGCASLPPPRGQQVERLSGEELEARLPQPASPISLAEVVAMSHARSAPESIVKRLREEHARFRLSATQIIELERQGVALTVLDHMVDAERHAIFDDAAADIARREQVCRERIAQEIRQCRLQATPLFWPDPFTQFPDWPAHPARPYWRRF